MNKEPDDYLEEQNKINIIEDSDSISIKELKNYFNQYFKYIKNEIISNEKYAKWYTKKEIRKVKQIIERIKLKELARFKEIEETISSIEDKVKYFQFLLAKIDQQLLTSQEKLK